MSLQFDSVRTVFAGNCAEIWRSWLTSGKPQREALFAKAVKSMTAFMIPPDVKFAHTGGWGSFNWTSWTLKVNQKYTGRNDIRYKDFVEVCSTIYHETRHGEQFYRIAQGLCAGKLKFPDASPAQNLQAMKVGTSSVSSRIAAFDAASQGKDPLEANPQARVATIAQRLDIPAGVAQHAEMMRGYFDNYLNSTRPAWFKRATVLDEVHEWMRATYKKTFSEMDTWAQGDDGPYRIYRDLPEENDAHGIEDVLQAELYRRIGNDTPVNRKKHRNDPVFGP